MWTSMLYGASAAILGAPAAVALAGVEEHDAAVRERAEQLAAEGAEPTRRGGPVLVVADD